MKKIQMCDCETECEECSCKENKDDKPEGFFQVDTTVALYGDIEAGEAKDIIYHMLSLKDVVLESGEPIQFLIASNGGSLADAFAIYDVMEQLKNQGIVIETKTIGKSFSAAVLLMAAGTKGRRSISKHCRVMIHRAVLDIVGNAADAKSEYDELMYRETQYLQALSDNSNLSLKQLKKMIESNANCYIGPEQAVEYGLVDFIE